MCVLLQVTFTCAIIIISDVLVLHTPIIKYIFEIYLGIICIAEGKNGKENMKGLKTVQLSTIVVMLLYRYLAKVQFCLISNYFIAG